MSETGSEGAPELRRWASRKHSTSNNNSRPSYQEMVKEKESVQKKREQMLDMHSWEKPKEGAIREGELEMAQANKDAKRSWEKRYFFLHDNVLLCFKNKKTDTPQSVMELIGSIIEAATDERSKKFVFKITFSKIYTQEMLIKDQIYLMSCESLEDMQGWFAALRNEIIKHTKQNVASEAPTIRVDADKVETLEPPKDSRGEWYNQTPTAKAIGDSEHEKEKDLKFSRRLSTASASDKKTDSSSRLRTTVDKDKDKERRASTASASSSSSLSKEEGKKLLKEKKKLTKKDLTPSSTMALMPNIIAPLPVQTKPILYYAPFFGGCNSIVIICNEHKLDIERVSIHLSWLTPYITGDKRALGPLNFKPKFLQVNSEASVPTYLDIDKDVPVMTDGIKILNHLLQKNSTMREAIYPEKHKSEIDAVLQWNMGHSVLELLKSFLQASKTESLPKNHTYSVDKVLEKAEELLKDNKGSMAGKKFTVADYYVCGEMLVIKQLFPNEYNKYANVKSWMNELEKLDSVKAVQVDLDQSMDDYPYFK